MKRQLRRIARAQILLSASMLVVAGWAGDASAEEQVSYKLDVKPILQSRCVEAMSLANGDTKRAAST